jgi:Protein of unknown function (DUF2721)
MSDPTNPYAALSLIVAPAVLTNASSLLVLSSSNRLARAVDRARALTAQLETPSSATDALTALRLTELERAETRAIMLLSALRFFYGSIGAFAAAALTSLVGAALLGSALRALPVAFEIIALAAGFLGVAGLVLGCVLLLRETRIAVRAMTEEATHLRSHFSTRAKSPHA